MNIHSVEGESPVERVDSSRAVEASIRTQPDFLTKVRGSISSGDATEGHLQHQPPIIFSKEDAQKLIECFEELFPGEKGLTIDGYLAKLHALCEEIKSNPTALESEEKAKTAAKAIQIICQIGIKSASAHVITPQIKGIVSGGVAAVSCISDLSAALRSLCDYVKDANPLMSSVGLTTASNSFAGLIAAVGDFKRLLEAYNIGDREGLIQANIAVLMDLTLSGGGFSFLVERFASMAAAAGNVPAAHVAAASAAVGLNLFGSFFMLIGVEGFRRLNNLAWLSEKLGIGLWEPKDLEALKFFKEKMEITPMKVFEELKIKYGKNLNEALKKESRLQAKTICWSMKNKGKAPGIDDLIAWGKDLMGLGSFEEKNEVEEFSLRLAESRSKENQENFKWLIELSKFNAEYPQLAELDQEELQGLSIVCSHMEARINKELARLTNEESVLKVQNYVEDTLKGRSAHEIELTHSQVEEAQSLSKELRTAYWQKVRESAGLVVIGGVGICVMVLSSFFNPFVVVTGTVFLNAFMAYGYDYKSEASVFSSKDPLKPYDKLVGWTSFGLGLVSVAACGVLLGASIASFGALPLAVAGIVLTVWIVSSCYNLYNLYARERFWNENEKMWQGQTIEGQLVRVDAIPKFLGGRVHDITHDELSSRVERIALHKIEEAIISKEKKKQAINDFKLKTSIFKIEPSKPITQDDVEKAGKWFHDIQKIITEEELRLNAILLGAVDVSHTPSISRDSFSDTVSEVSALGLSSIARSSITSEASDVSVTEIKSDEIEKIKKGKVKKVNVSRVAFPVSIDLDDLQKKIEKTKGHIKYLESKQQGTKKAGAGRQKKVSLSEQISVHQKRLEKLELEKKSHI